jgi:hypothetical protein
MVLKPLQGLETPRDATLPSIHQYASSRDVGFTDARCSPLQPSMRSLNGSHIQAENWYALFPLLS